MDREQQDRLQKMAAEQQAQLCSNLAGVGQIGKIYTGEQTTEPHPRIWEDPRGWAHDITRYHKPSGEGLQRIDAIRAATENLLNEIIRSCPQCQDREGAINCARMAMMLANASIALDGRV